MDNHQLMNWIKKLFKRKDIRYIIKWSKKDDFAVLYKTYQEAENKRLSLDKNAGKILKVTIEEI